MGFSSFSGLIVRPGIDRCNMTDGWPQPPHEGVVSAAKAHQPSSLEDIYTITYFGKGAIFSDEHRKWVREGRPETRPASIYQADQDKRRLIISYSHV